MFALRESSIYNYAMDISDILFNSYIDGDLKRALVELVIDNNITSSSIRLVTPTSTNDDVDGSQRNGSDFTYRDVTEEEVAHASSLGYYEYFSRQGDIYTGHYYQGEGQKFDAIVIDPPAYEVDIYL